MKVVYFILCPGFVRPIVKIGSACDPRKRLEALQCGCPLDLILTAVMIGGYREEVELHKRFASARSRGEWFYMNKEIQDFIDNNCETSRLLTEKGSVRLPYSLYL